jgi:hypothetical protein
MTKLLDEQSDKSVASTLTPSNLPTPATLALPTPATLALPTPALLVPIYE